MELFRAVGFQAVSEDPKLGLGKRLSAKTQSFQEEHAAVMVLTFIFRLLARLQQ